MSFEEEIRKVKKEVEEAVRLIMANHAGANLDEARKLLSEAGEALKRDRFDEAAERAKSAQLAAKPTTGYLLDRAKSLSRNAEKEYEAEEYDKARELWNQSVTEYQRTLELARARSETEFIDKLEHAVNTITQNITKSEISKDNRIMLDLVADANSNVRTANDLYEQKRYEEAKKRYDTAKGLFRDALAIAKSRAFNDDRAKIQDALTSVENSIEACLLSKGAAMLKTAETSLNSNFAAAEHLFSSALDFLNSLKVKNNDERLNLVKRTQKGLIGSKIEQGKAKMENAERLFSAKKFYDAQNVFTLAEEYFKKVRNEAAGFKLDVTTITNFIQACTTNIKTAIDNLTATTHVKEVPIKVRDVVEGKAKYTPPEEEEKEEGGWGKSPPFFPPALNPYYSDVQYIGQGGFAWVFKARNEKGEIVALKIPKHLDRDSKAGKVFINEISVWRGLKHENIVGLSDYDISPAPYLELEFVESSLDETKKPMPTEDAAEMIFKIAEGLRYAHQREKPIIHRDLKPSNVLLTNSTPKISDWGLGKVMGDSVSSSKYGYTPLYAAPELIYPDEFGKTDERTDIFQLGTIFYELLTGERPFEADTRIEIESAIRMRQPKRPSEINPVVSGKCDAIVMKCIAKRKEQRYQNVHELRLDLAGYLKEEYKKSLKVSSDSGDSSKSAFYCGKLTLYNAELGDYREAVKYAEDLKIYIEKLRRDVRTVESCKIMVEMVETSYQGIVRTEHFLDKLKLLEGYTDGLSERITKEINTFRRFLKEELFEYVDDEHKEDVRRFCRNLLDVWISELLR